MTGASFILMHKAQDKAENARQVLSFFDWAFKNGGKAAEDLDYVPLPDHLVKLIQAEWKAKLKDAGGKPIYQ
jgi:phosphate transport system substrate-binding protein